MQDRLSKTETRELVPAAWRRGLVGSLRGGWLRLNLPAKLLLLTIGFVLLAEVLIFLPAMANYRQGWLNDRLTAAHVAALAADAMPTRDVPPALRSELLRTALVRAIALKRGGQRRLVLPPVTELTVDSFYDMRPLVKPTTSEALSDWFSEIGDALAVFLSGDDRTIRVIGPLGPRDDDVIEIVIPEEPLKRAMVAHALNLTWISVIISVITAAFVYLALNSLLVRPMRRITRSMLHFSENPEDPERIIVPSARHDEVGTAERELASMQKQLSQQLLQKNRLAQLGLAVSKINHDLRNMLANAQLISDRLTTIADPTVQTFAPKLIASLDRAINFCTDSLRFGRAEEATPRRELMLLKPLIEDVGDALFLPRDGQIGFAMDIDDTLRIDADREQLFRIISNLVRNAVQAIESQDDAKGEIRISGRREGRKVTVEVSDDGPGVPAAARQHLFRAFQGSTRIGGTGLGLAIAQELTAVHGGTLKLADTARGATFVLELPDRATH
ncbi:MAG: HAMP domain-containing sensor histidine kinase [Hyphomicrobiaceae bacterium]|nr:HAMP domain-containing sensor histidine kinase [Hyphomicrobiaceae bacterium]